MLQFLNIRNLALIDNMSLEFSSGMNVITGESGAGKSFILKALGFLLGDKLSADLVRPSAEKAQIEALFELDGSELVLRRELLAESGRSRIFINDTLSSQDSLKNLRMRLVVHASQHAQQQLLQPSFQTQIFENRLPCKDLLDERGKILGKLEAIGQEKQKLQQKLLQLREKRDLFEMQLQEIDAVHPQAGEEEQLEEIRVKVRSQAALCHEYEKTMGLLLGSEVPGLIDQLSELERHLSKINAFDNQFAEICDTVADTRQALQGLANNLHLGRHSSDDVDIEKIEARLFSLAQLKRKLHRTLPEILQLKEEIEEGLSWLDASNLDFSHLEKEEAKLASQLLALIKEIAPIRRKSSNEFVSLLEKELKGLGFSENLKVIPEFFAQEIWPSIVEEHVQILWQPNPGHPPQPLNKIASGGELSRFLLALMSLQEIEKSTTYIFDEVDAGVGGMTLNKLADKLTHISSDHQMILITHWPQLASRADRHFQISKSVHDGSTFTTCKAITGTERKDELVRMSGGGNPMDILPDE